MGATKIREKLKIDLTSNKLYSITDKTLEVLKSLNEKVEIIGLFDESKMGDSQYAQVIEFVKQYETNSDYIDVKYVDPDKNPGYIQNELDPEGILGVEKYDFVVRSSKRSKVLSTYDIFDVSFSSSTYSYQVTGLNAEYAFTGAIRYVTSDNIPVIYYTEGHGEDDVKDDYSELVSSLELNGYRVEKINLASVDKIPDDASIILFVNPQRDLSDAELDKLLYYMENGGNTVFLFSPANTKLANFEEFLSRYNVSLGYDVIFEMAANKAFYGQPYRFIPTVESNSINSVLEPDKFTMPLAYAQSIQVLKNEKDWITVTPLLSTSSEAVGKSLFEGVEDKNGPFYVGVAGENNGYNDTSKTIVIGNAYFVSDDGMSVYDTGKKFLVNAINWMQDSDADIYIPVKEYTTPRLTKVTQQTLTILFIGLIIVVPLIIMGAGVFVWLRRRHL
ncbi:ABC transporter [Thermoclostridium stercorarium subsp. stercorarium DSM 8532]|nr:ABC transporter [Thermoclostridium stercorarium subsp. stercorarium DSM 8532]